LELRLRRPSSESRQGSSHDPSRVFTAIEQTVSSAFFPDALNREAFQFYAKIFTLFDTFAAPQIIGMIGISTEFRDRYAASYYLLNHRLGHGKLPGTGKVSVWVHVQGGWPEGLFSPLGKRVVTQEVAGLI